MFSPALLINPLNMSKTSCVLCCSALKMLLRMLWCRLGAQLSANRKPGFKCASTSFLQTVQPHKYESKARTWDLNARHQHQRDTRRVPPALSGLNYTSTLFADPGTLAKYEQKRFYSTDLVKSMLKPSLKGKRVPKGPRTKQPSRANQPSLNEDQVTNQISHLSCIARHVLS